MKKIFFSVLLIFSFNFSAASENDIFRDEDEIMQGLQENQWNMFLGVEILQLKSIPSFSFPDHQILTSGNENLYGPTLGVARKWWLAGNLSTSTEPTLFYLVNDDTSVLVPTNSEFDGYHVSELRSVSQFYGARISQTLAYAFEFTPFLFEPFVQFYVGQAFGRTKVDYHWDTNIAAEHEQYGAKLHENVYTQGFAAGFQFIARNGFLSFIKVSSTTLTYRKKDTEMQTSGAGVINSISATKTTSSEKLDKYLLSLGVGYIF